MVDISIPQKPRFLPFFGSLLMSGALHQSCLKCVVCKDRLSVQEKLSFDCWCKGTTIWSWKQIFPLQIFLWVSVSSWLIVLYNDISEINCCILTDFEENEGLWLRILEKRSFPVMVIFGQNHFRGRSVILYYNIAHFDRFHFHFDRKWPWPILTGFCFLHSKCLSV